MTKISLTSIAWRLSPGTRWSAQSLPKPGFHVFMLCWHCDCPGNTARMVTAGFSRLKPRTVTCEDELGPKLSPGKFTLTPSWLVPFPDLSLQMAEERGMGSGSINVILHIFTSGKSKMTECISHTKNGKVKAEKKPRPTLENYMTNPWTDVEFYTQSKWLQVPARLLAWNSWLMRGSRFRYAWVHSERQEQRRRVDKQMLNFEGKEMTQCKASSVKKYLFDWSKWAWLGWIK